jgi:hypothetical protein
VLQSVQVGVERKFEHVFHLENETLHTHETHRHYRSINQQGVLMTPEHRDSVCSSGYLGVVNMSLYLARAQLLLQELGRPGADAFQD